jgi:hypothetical protein
MKYVLVMCLAMAFLISGKAVWAANDIFGTTPIKYVTWDGTQWSATIQDITLQTTIGINGIEVGHTITDPDFRHVENGTKDSDPLRRSDYMDYIADNGTHWRAWIHTHDHNIEFEHCPESGDHNHHGCHSDTIINFRTWDGTCERGTLHPIPTPGPTDSVPVNITFQPIPCH